MRKITFSKEFDAIILLWNSFGYFSDEENEKLIKNIHKALKKNGYFVLEIINRDWIIRHFTPKNWRKLGDTCEFARFEIPARDGASVPTIILEEREFIPEESRVRGKITYMQGDKRMERTTNFRFYSYHEIRAIFESAGFREIQGYGSLEETPIEFDTHLMEIIGKK
jgi:SAM-dependent methyltransferase